MGKLADAAIVGVYQTKQGDLSDKTQPSVWWECVRGVCEDAGLSMGDIDGLVNDGPDGVGLRDGIPATGLAEMLGHPIRFHARNIVGAVAPEDVRIGMPVQITYEDVTRDWTLMYFEPAPATTGGGR
jgi:hypothetical protein